MEDAEKLHILIEHWIEHNTAHGAEFDQWARQASTAGLQGVASQITAAAGCLQNATDCLRAALTHLGPDSGE